MIGLLIMLRKLGLERKEESSVFIQLIYYLIFQNINYCSMLFLKSIYFCVRGFIKLNFEAFLPLN